MTALRSGEFVPPSDDTYDPNADMRALQGAHKRKQKEDVFMSRDQLMELRKVQAERIEVRPLFPSLSPASHVLPGWKDEASWHGNQAEHGCSHGWHHVRRLTTSPTYLGDLIVTCTPFVLRSEYVLHSYKDKYNMLYRQASARRKYQSITTRGLARTLNGKYSEIK